MFIIVTRHFFYKKMFMVKVIQNFMEITLSFNCFSEKTCWKMLFNILFSVSIFDTMFLFWFFGGCCLVAIAWSRIRLQMSTKKRSKFKLEELFSASSFGECLYIKSDLHKILDNFYLNSFHIEETTMFIIHKKEKRIIQSRWSCPSFILGHSTVVTQLCSPCKGEEIK